MADTDTASDTASGPGSGPGSDLATGVASGSAPISPQEPAAPSVSVVLAAATPEALARFYGALLQVPVEPGLSASHWRVPLPGSGLLELYAPSRLRPLQPPGGRLAPCLRRGGDGETLAAWVAAACALGAQLEEGPRQEPFGWEVWLRDPEGNPLLLLVSPA